MSHFYGTLKGCRGEATRCGSKDSGIETWTASWEGAVCVVARRNEKDGRDWVSIRFAEWHGRGTRKVIYEGPIDGSIDIPRDQLRLITHLVDEASNKLKPAVGDTVRVSIPKAIYEQLKELVIRKVVDS